MHFTTTAALAAALAVLAVASPVKKSTAGRFSVTQVSVGKKVAVHPAKEVLKTYQKFGKQAPAHVANAAQKHHHHHHDNNADPTTSSASAASAASTAATTAVVASSNSVNITGSVTNTPTTDDEEYLCPVTIGNQTLTLDFDTGSSDLWVFSTLTPSDEVDGQTQYNVDQGVLETGETWDIDYGDGSGASGTVYADKVVVGGVTVTSQAVEAATSVSTEFVEDTNSDGLLGLAFSSINTVTPTKADTFFDNAGSSLEQNLFTADLKKGAAGTYNFGYIDTSLYTGDITYVDVDNSEGYWGFTPSTELGSSIVDTGTTLFYLPTTEVEAYYADVDGAEDSEEEGGYVFDCSATLPDYNVTIDDVSFTVPGSYLNYSVATGSTCFGGLQSSEGIGFNIFGDIFIKSQFIVFSSENADTPQLGFAAKDLST